MAGVGLGTVTRMKHVVRLLLIVCPMIEIAVFAVGLAQVANIAFVGL